MKGSEKQIAWAMDIKANAINELDAMIENTKVFHSDRAAMWNVGKEFLVKFFDMMDNAGDIIAKRTMIESVVEKMLDLDMYAEINGTEAAYKKMCAMCGIK